MRTWPFTLRRRRMAFYGLTRGHFAGTTHMVDSGRGLARLRFVSLSCDINEPIAKTVEKLNRFQPNTLSGYSTVLTMLAEQQLKGALRISPEYVAHGGEPLTPEDRVVVNQAFGEATILNHYGSSEHLSMGIGRSEYGGIYLFEDELIFEMEEERTLATNLFNRTEPLIRYVMDDLLEKLEDPNPVFPFAKIRDIAGRPKPNPVFTNRHGEEDHLNSNTFVEFFVPNVIRFQLRVLDKSSCLFRVRLKDGLSAEERSLALAQTEKRLSEIFAEKEMENVERRIEAVDNFGGGKVHLIVTPEMAVQRHASGPSV